jgi:hypothetical protein
MLYLKRNVSPYVIKVKEVKLYLIKHYAMKVYAGMDV